MVRRPCCEDKMGVLAIADCCGEFQPIEEKYYVDF